MTRNIFIATAEPYSGKSIIALGLVDMLLSKARKIGYFKPIVNFAPETEKDPHIETVINHFGLSIPYEETFAYTQQEALRLIEMGLQGEIIDKIISQFKKLEESYDFTVIEGSDFLGQGTAFQFDANVTIAKNLGAPVIIVVSAEGETSEQLISSVRTIKHNFEVRDVQVLAVIANKVNPEQLEEVNAYFGSQQQSQTIYAAIPEDQNLKSPTMQEVLEVLGGKLLFGQQQLFNQADHSIMGAMQVPNFLNHIRENVLIVTPGDRADIILSALQANLSVNYPKVAGLVLTGGFEPEESVIRLMEGLQTVVPIIAVKGGSFHTATVIGNIKSRITPENTRKIQLAIDTFKKYVNVQALEEKIVTFTPEGITPHMFQYQLVKWAKQKKQHIVLPEGEDVRILRAAVRLIQQEIVDLTLLGDADRIAALVKQNDINLDLDHLRIINPVASEYYQEYVETLYELRKSKNVQLEMARDLMTDVSYFGTMMVYKGHADGMVSGAVHTTMHTIRPALQFIKTKPGVSVVSSVFFMCLPDRVSVFGDCAVNPNPTAAQLAEIAISSAESSQRFGIEPRVAMLSYSSGTSGEGVDVEKVRQATEIVKQKRPDLKVEGPIQYDAAVDPVVGRQKLPQSEVAGRASVLIFPDLNTGNNTYKAVQRETGALAIGPMLQGLNKPVNDLSRGCTVDDIFNTVVITAIQGQS
ncbi:phosphate acetyltransferase [Pontibacter sp. 172403-2]|uniref:phosphate acetyltransferase n=1 Tax=Pontibacter rufus TaxID=2791028 RepID=UPI0018B00715|nr:phosphate acetyltransferase [Pontibacter sp. 172403-2]MBF9254152.1 phosphate acetyltransferase [Pontibacter sp. 172403-2]